MKHAASITKTPERVIAYIDGFNLYFGLKSQGFKRFLWLNLKVFCCGLLRPNQTLAAVKYFTSRVSFPPEKARRQNAFLEALGTTDVRIYYGNYQINKRTCTHCGKIDHVPNEKMTDVNIAAEMLSDGFLNKFDTAILVSADGDLRTPVAITAQTAGKRVVVAFPPGRRAFKLEDVASATIFLRRRHFENCQFPPQVTKANGFILNRPKEWV